MHIFDSLMYTDVDEEGFDTLLEEHPGVLSNMKRALSKACKTKLQEILDESKNGEIPLKDVSSNKANNALPTPFLLSLIESAAGTLGNPGIVIIAPQTTTINSAPEESLISLIGKACPVGAPFRFGSVEKLY